MPRGFLSAVQVAEFTQDRSETQRSPGTGPMDHEPGEPAHGARDGQSHLASPVWSGLGRKRRQFRMIGKQPSHPQLLDALALRFMQEGWSVKRMIRAIMLSRSYQLSSTRRRGKHEDRSRQSSLLASHSTATRSRGDSRRDPCRQRATRPDSAPSGSTVTPLGDQLVRGIPTEKIQPPSNHRSVYLPVVRDYLPELFRSVRLPFAQLGEWASFGDERPLASALSAQFDVRCRAGEARRQAASGLEGSDR